MNKKGPIKAKLFEDAPVPYDAKLLNVPKGSIFVGSIEEGISVFRRLPSVEPQIELFFAE